MNPSILAAAVPCLFLFGGLLSLIRTGRRFAPSVTIVVSLCAFGLSVLTASRVMNAGELVVVRGWVRVGDLGALLLLLITFVGALSAIYSLGYMRSRASDRSDRTLRLYHLNFNLFLFSIVAVPMMEQVALTWVAVELTTLLSVMLVSFDGTREALEAAWKYVILTMVGAAIALLGIIILYKALSQTQSTAFTWTALRAAGAGMNPTLMRAAFLLILVGFGVKVGFAPLHTWLPDAHSQAPSPVCAVLSGVETSTILYVILRLLPVVADYPSLHARTWVVVFGLISVGAAAFLLIQVRDLKRLFAFSTVEHMGIILVAAGLGATDSWIAPYQLFAHGLVKPLCFFAAGAALVAIGTRDIASLRGLIRRQPLTGAALLVGALGVTGAPPFALFLSEFSIVRAGVTSGAYVAVGFLVLFIVVAFAAVVYHVNGVVFGAVPSAPGESRRAVPRASLVAIVLAMIPVVLFGVWIPDPLFRLIHLAGSVLGGA